MRALGRYILMAGLAAAGPAWALSNPADDPGSNTQIRRDNGQIEVERDNGAVEVDRRGTAERGLEKAGEATGEALDAAARATEKGLRAAGKATGKGIEKAGEGMDRAGEWVQDKSD